MIGKMMETKRYKIIFEVIVKESQEEVEKYVNDILYDMTGEEIEGFEKVKVEEV